MELEGPGMVNMRNGLVWKPSAKGMAGIDCLITGLSSKRYDYAATYLRNTRDELFIVAKLKEHGIAPGLVLVMVATSAIEREFREINRWTEVGTGWSCEGVERVAKLLEEVRLSGTRLEF